MITINLLPRDSRTSATASLQQFSRSPLAVVMVGALAGLTLLFVVVKGVQQVRLTRVTGEIQQRMSRKAMVDRLKETVGTLRARHAVYARLDRDRSQWARRLNALSTVMPEGVWLTDLSVDPQQAVLTLEGSAIGEGEEKMNRLGRLVQELKRDPVFSMAVRDVQIESIKSVLDGELEVVNFTIRCGLTTPPAAPTR